MTNLLPTCSKLTGAVAALGCALAVLTGCGAEQSDAPVTLTANLGDTQSGVGGADASAHDTVSDAPVADVEAEDTSSTPDIAADSSATDVVAADTEPQSGTDSASKDTSDSGTTDAAGTTDTAGTADTTGMADAAGTADVPGTADAAGATDAAGTADATDAANPPSDTSQTPKPNGSTAQQATPSCKALKAAWPQLKSGMYWLKPSAAAKAVRTWCDQERAGGGWTLVIVSADDGDDTWTWDNRLLWTTKKDTVGSPDKLFRDYKSALYHQVATQDVLFIHFPSSVWAAYNGIGNGKDPFGAIVAAVGEPKCWTHNDGWAMSAGTLKQDKKLCSTRLFISPMDHDGKSKCGDDDHAYGPAWSASNNSGCPFDDPGESGGFGPIMKEKDEEEEARGFGRALDLNDEKKGAKADRIWLLVR